LHPTLHSARLAILTQILPNLHAFHSYRAAVQAPLPPPQLTWWQRWRRRWLL
jgi:hypothetical protein